MAEAKTVRRRKKTTPKPVAEAPVATIDTAKEQPKAESIDISKSKVLPKDKKYTKIVAIRSSMGVFGSHRYHIQDGQTYNFPTELATWLIETGRAK